MNEINTQAQADQLAIELDENGMVVVNDPELLKLAAGAGALKPEFLIGKNDLCGWKMQ